MTRIHPIRTVKREIRILGIDACNPKHLVGVVVRGGNYLDGIVLFQYEKNKNTEALGDQVKHIPYFPELRAIMLHDPKNRLDPDKLEKSSTLPIIQVRNNSKVKTSSQSKRNFKVGRLTVKTKVPISTSRKIIDLTWTYGTLPEPLRVAHLLNKNFST